ncbi:MAG: GAF domain-containing protein [Sphaerochaetaceae bacterium]|nr:GAF domain-containing protein [Sphaerochaetaceae bacterium]
MLSADLLLQLDGLIGSEKVPLRELYSSLANVSALLAANMEEINWVGFYLVQDPTTLILGPFQGKVACTTIPFGKGVCGTAWREKRVLVVPNVEAFEGHIVCDSASQSEVVIPIIKGSEVVGVLDIDSPKLDRFTPQEVELLTAVAERLALLF